MIVREIRSNKPHCFGGQAGVGLEIKVRLTRLTVTTCLSEWAFIKKEKKKKLLKEKIDPKNQAIDGDLKIALGRWPVRPP